MKWWLQSQFLFLRCNQYCHENVRRIDEAQDMQDVCAKSHLSNQPVKHLIIRYHHSSSFSKSRLEFSHHNPMRFNRYD